MAISVLEDGFSINLPTGIKTVLWKEIEEIHAYKADMMTYDEICMDIHLSESILTISEETLGWDLLVSALYSVFPSITKNWETLIIKPAFTTNEIILYKK